MLNDHNFDTKTESVMEILVPIFLIMIYGMHDHNHCHYHFSFVQICIAIGH